MPQAEPLPVPSHVTGAWRQPISKEPKANGPTARVHYPDSDGKPMSESGIHWRATVNAGVVLDSHHLDRADAHVSGNLFMYYEEGNPKAAVSPDLFVAYGVAKEPPRRVWKVWEEGKAADFILEVTSKSSKNHDERFKAALYERLLVTEYWQFDPTRDYLDPELKGRRLGRDGKYRELTLDERDGGLCGHSEVLGLDLQVKDGQLRFFDPKRGEYLLAPGEQRRVLDEQTHALRATAAERDAAKTERDAAQAELLREADARRAAEARIAELERQLRSRD